MGFSTLISALMFLDTMNTPNTYSMQIAQDETNAKILFQMITRFYENLPPHKRRKSAADSQTSIYWEDIDSRFYVGWAGSKKLGRSGTYNNIHASEISRWENTGELVTGLFQAVPEDGNIFLESTAAGVDNYYYTEYQSAQEGSSLYTPRFYPWFTEPGYSAPRLVLGGDFIPDEDELILQARYNLTNEQLIWRRNKITELKNAFLSGDDITASFQQEYPSNPEEAFLTTGSSYFDKKFIIDELMPKTSPPLMREAPSKYSTLARVRIQNTGKLSLWKMPEAGHRYIISADPSGGIATTGKEDFCSSDIIDVETWEQVGTLHGRWEPAEYAHLLAELGEMYNRALIVVLSMNHGHSVLNTLINVISYTALDGFGGIYEYIDPLAPKSHPKPGYPENVKTKITMLSSLTELVHTGSLKVNSKETLREMSLFSKLPGYKLGAIVGHDDRVSSLAVGAVVLKDVAYAKTVVRRSGIIKRGKITTQRKTGML